VLKKAGIITGAVVAGVLALSPIAFAGEHHQAPVNHTNVSDGNVGNDCDFDAAGALVRQGLTGGDALAGAAGLVSGIASPVDAQTQAANCTNVVSDSVSNDNSGNTSRTSTSDVTRGSFNS
jgi:hypothetical protein